MVNHQVVAAVDADPCNCFPKEITFKLNLGGSCDDDDINLTGGAVSESTCSIDEEMVIDLLVANEEISGGSLEPVTIIQIDVIECITGGIFCDYIAQTQFSDSGNNIDSFTYATQADEITSQPVMFQLNIRGMNQEGALIRNDITISYLNECGVPVIEAGNYIGWVVVVSRIHCQ